MSSDGSELNTSVVEGKPDLGRVGFVGFGQMATALAGGIVNAELIRPDDVTVYDVFPGAVEKGREKGFRTAKSTHEIGQTCQIIFLAVKPQEIPTVLAELRGVPNLKETKPLIISIAAGITLKMLESTLEPVNPPVIRVMPNTPCLVGETAAAYALGHMAKTRHAKIVDTLLNAVGMCYEVKESLMDAVTGLSGSGPAYVFLMIEALADGGVRAGLPRPVALSLAAQTVYGASKLVKETGKHPGELKDIVCSPGGTTIAGIHALEDGGTRANFINAVVAATNRSKELSELAKKR